MKTVVAIAASLFLMCLMAGPLTASQQIFNPGGQSVSISQPATYNPSPLLPATLVDSWDTTPEHNWSLNADFSWANAWDTNDITAPHMLTELQYYANPTLGVTYEFYMTTDNGGIPDDSNMTLLSTRSDLDGGGVFGWVTVDVSAAQYQVQPGQIYWFVRRCPVGGWPGFTWSSATAPSPTMPDPVKITKTFQSGGWSNWVTGYDWWMMFRFYGDPAGPMVDIKCNGGDAGVQIPVGTNAKLDFNVVASTAAGLPVDVWLGLNHPLFGWFTYDTAGPYMGWNLGLSAAYFTGALANMSGTCLDFPLGIGAYKAGIGIDTTANGSFNWPLYLIDIVDFTVY
jgi:hypothetical protein